MTARPLTPKETKLIDGIVKGKTKRQAAMDAYNASTIETAGSIASEALRKPNVQEALVAAFKKHGIDLDSAIKPIAEGLKAEKVSIVGNGDQSMAEIAPDHSIRLKASGMALNLMGLGKQGGDVSITFIDASTKQKSIYEL